MTDTDWREILSFSQKELLQADKEKLCEGLSWMEADDIELNFTDLKTLFRLAQDILKYKSEQVNNLHGQLETVQRKHKKTKTKGTHFDSPAKSSDSVLETIALQEEEIKANKEVLEQLYADIAELEGKKNKLEENKDNFDKESESSRDALSEINEVAQLENEITSKNRHIRKLLNDVKVLEEENTKLKEKLSIFKEKLNEATKLIENLTEQLLTLNNESTSLKDLLGKSEESKTNLTMKIEALEKELTLKDFSKETSYNEIKTKCIHWKNVARSKKSEIDTLANENTKLKESLIRASQPQQSVSPKNRQAEERKIKELQQKLSEASKEIEQTADLIEHLKAENIQLKSVQEEPVEMLITESRNESDDNKEKSLINKLKKKIKSLHVALQKDEDMITLRDKELADITSQLQLVQSDEGISKLLEELKTKKRQLKSKDEGIKSLVLEVNTLNQAVDELQLENEIFRQKLNISPDKKIGTKGIMKKYHEMEEKISRTEKYYKKAENKLTQVELDNRFLKTKISKLTNLLTEQGCSMETLDRINHECECYSSDTNEDETQKTVIDNSKAMSKHSKPSICNCGIEMQAIIDENEGLRKGLQEILDFLKDNSATSSGVLSLECPSLDAILQSMEARHAAGWFAPHMATVMELRAALGGKDALLTALHEARKETFTVMDQLTKESQKSVELEHKLQEMELKHKQNENVVHETQKEKDLNIMITPGEFGSWVSFADKNEIDFENVNQIDNLISQRNSSYENYLKKGLGYFHEKFKVLFEKMTSIVVQTADQQNKWSIQEEQYKAMIENLKTQLHQVEQEDISEDSPGLITIPATGSLERKCTYLEESYRYIRTLNENMKNEILESKKESMLSTLDYETQTQNCMLIIANLFDKLRNSIPIDLFWKQNYDLNQAVTNYRKILEVNVKKEESVELMKVLENLKTELLNNFRNDLKHNDFHPVTDKINAQKLKAILDSAQQTILTKQLEEMCSQLEKRDSKITILESKNNELQATQAKLIDEKMPANTQEEIDLMINQLQNLAEDNRLLKEQCQHIGSQLDIALMQLQDAQQRQLSYDMEINMLRHQILDLQSTGDNKAIIARLSGEVLVAHLQASESHKKIDRLGAELNKEKQSRVEAEEMLKARQKIFDVYTIRYESKFRYMYEVMQVLRQQYHGSLPITSIENYLNKMEELNRKTYAASEKLQDIEDLQYNLMTKHSVFDQILDLSKNKCLEEEDGCSHKLKMMVQEGINSRETDHYSKKILTLEQSREDLRKYCNKLENTLVLVNQGFEKSHHNIKKNDTEKDNISILELEDVHSDEETYPRKSLTITLDKPQVLKPVLNQSNGKSNNEKKVIIPRVPSQTNEYNQKVEQSTKSVQTVCLELMKEIKHTQTDIDRETLTLKSQVTTLKAENDGIKKELNNAKNIVSQKVNEINKSNSQKKNFESMIESLKDSISQKDISNERLRMTIEELRKQNDDFRSIQIEQRNKLRDTANEENKSLLVALKQLETDKNNIVAEYQKLLQVERDEYSKSIKDLNSKILELQSKLDSTESDITSSSAQAVKEAISKYTAKIANLEDKYFKAQNELDGSKTELVTYQSEIDRWKDLAIERLAKMEHLSSQLEERHCHEVESYKAENQHWLSQLNDTQREHLELRSKLTEQKTLYVKQLADKDAIIEQLRSAVHNLKTQIISMQTMISINDPSFDLSAIVEVDENSDMLSHHGSDRLELKFDSTVEFHDMDEMIRMPASSTAIWQEPVIERLRQEKQMAGKQNAILRRQIKALAARERRARLDAQNLKNQVFRIVKTFERLLAGNGCVNLIALLVPMSSSGPIQADDEEFAFRSTSGSKAATAESAALQSKVASLQAQLMTARRDTNSSIALWDKWKRAQQTSDRWQARYEEKCQEVKKLESNLNLAKSAVARLEKEKRLLLSRLDEVKHERQQLSIEKQESEAPEKSYRASERESMYSPPPVSAQALLDRVQAQQRRIAALEVAEKGNEVLVSEYERALAEITSLKGQVLKLESTLLESQIRIPIQATQDAQPEVDYWKSYCDMLKEENVQLNMRVNALETTPTTANQHRVNDLEQTVLTLRGLVSKLQADQKSSAMQKRSDSRPGSGRSSTDQSRKQIDPHRIEIANLKRSLQDKDLLLEKSKEMLKIAAEREDELLRENSYLRRRLDEITSSKGGFLSA